MKYADRPEAGVRSPSKGAACPIGLDMLRARSRARYFGTKYNMLHLSSSFKFIGRAITTFEVKLIESYCLTFEFEGAVKVLI